MDCSAREGLCHEQVFIFLTWVPHPGRCSELIHMGISSARVDLLGGMIISEKLRMLHQIWGSLKCISWSCNCLHEANLTNFLHCGTYRSHATLCACHHWSYLSMEFRSWSQTNIKTERSPSCTQVEELVMAWNFQNAAHTHTDISCHMLSDRSKWNE